MKCLFVQSKRFEFLPSGGTLTQKITKFFYPKMTIYTPIESPHQVDKKYAVFKNIRSDFQKPH